MKRCLNQFLAAVAPFVVGCASTVRGGGTDDAGSGGGEVGSDDTGSAGTTGTGAGAAGDWGTREEACRSYCELLLAQTPPCGGGREECEPECTDFLVSENSKGCEPEATEFLKCSANNLLPSMCVWDEGLCASADLNLHTCWGY